MMATVSGAVCIVAGIARLGFVTELLSKPIRYGYMNGIVLAVLVSQTPKLVGVKIEEAGPLRDLWSVGAEIVGGRANWVAFALGAATLATILSARSFKGTPGVLAAVIGATAIVQVFDLQALSEQRQVVCVGRSTRRPKRRLGREGAPLGQRGGAPLFVSLAGDEMALLIEMVVDVGMN